VVVGLWEGEGSAALWQGRLSNTTKKTREWEDNARKKNYGMEMPGNQKEGRIPGLRNTGNRIKTLV
jgi:hypothetical protein